ncbi:hypothetical protein KFK09_022576 [Dendrobium nobile]|uniref:Uncharacterized protein n=1 Tax=Dendrobium nobile TaxID=94219 RepID=A0A8T3AKD6_DENNO|nr:hypothetical protein KFK09_022576 [Dendrobium nobile]
MLLRGRSGTACYVSGWMEVWFEFTIVPFSGCFRTGEKKIDASCFPCQELEDQTVRRRICCCGGVRERRAMFRAGWKCGSNLPSCHFPAVFGLQPPASDRKWITGTGNQRL